MVVGRGRDDAWRSVAASLAAGQAVGFAGGGSSGLGVPVVAVAAPACGSSGLGVPAVAVAAPACGAGAGAVVCVIARSEDWAVAAGPAAGCGVRRDSRATTMVIAAASTASPASWPPIIRGSSGSADDVTPARWWSWRWRPAADGPVLADGLGVTTGKRLVSGPGVTVVLGRVG